MIETALKIKQKESFKLRYNKLKHRLDALHGNETILKFKILNEAFKVGQQIYGRYFSIAKLSIDMEVPYTTVKRVMSLGKASPYAWRMIRTSKIGAHKVAQILMSISREKQDDIIRLAIKDNLSTHQIKKIRLYDGDVKKFKLQTAIEKGFAGKWNATHAIVSTAERLYKLLDIDVSSYPVDKKVQIEVALKNVKNKIESFISKVNKY